MFKKWIKLKLSPKKLLDKRWPLVMSSFEWQVHIIQVGKYFFNRSHNVNYAINADHVTSVHFTDWSVIYWKWSPAGISGLRHWNFHKRSSLTKDDHWSQHRLGHVVFTDRRISLYVTGSIFLLNDTYQKLSCLVYYQWWSCDKCAFYRQFCKL